ncbi:acyl-CoA dehydrogenase family protein [Actinomadura bangladeshensis]|uniref:Dehydrogenase n=1 Tax=Actinomadura bangladeshensis TaxID=453573 RepID=A0A4R4PCZ6_9ACTN|nr:acyl-CoA dehydrogenase family protein [Actinomadura bangladeshensis]TDC20365.1 dehydrogenase [Actinomadura bangladeshensis]
MNQHTERVAGTSEEELAELGALLAGLDLPAEDPESIEASRAYLRALAPGGWLVPGWPPEWGGRGADGASAARIRSVLRKGPAPDIYPFFVGVYMVGPTLLAHGDDVQRALWLPPLVRGEHVWCQMFSEPGAGSDLANVATRAERTEDGWCLRGQKVWTSRGSYADWAICLARTDPEVPKHDGLTMFAVKMDAPGVTVRPLRQMNGDEHFSEVFVDDLVVPDAHRIGAVGEGWKIALGVLSHERSSIGAVAGRARPANRDVVPRWLQALAKSGTLADPVRCDEAMALYVELEVTRLAGARSAARTRATGRPGPEASGHKIRVSDSRKRRAYVLTRLLGAEGLGTGHRGYQQLLTAPSHSLRGGTDEIQRNIVAERVLGLPAEPRLDRGVPWSVSRRGVT